MLISKLLFGLLAPHTETAQVLRTTSMTRLVIWRTGDLIFGTAQLYIVVSIDIYGYLGMLAKKFDASWKKILIQDHVFFRAHAIQ